MPKTPKIRAPKIHAPKPKTMGFLSKAKSLVSSFRKKEEIKKKKGKYNLRDEKGRFLKKGRKIAPIMYKRSIPPGMVRVEAKELTKKFNCGMLIEFEYGKQQKPGQVGGWKTNKKPVLLVFYDDGVKYIEGVNTNYLSKFYLTKLNALVKRFPGVLGDQFYKIVKRSAPFAVKKGYRKYIRSSLKRCYIYAYEEDIRTIMKVVDPQSKETDAYIENKPHRDVNREP